jgi:hypothetical protein
VDGGADIECTVTGTPKTLETNRLSRAERSSLAEGG